MNKNKMKGGFSHFKMFIMLTYMSKSDDEKFQIQKHDKILKLKRALYKKCVLHHHFNRSQGKDPQVFH
jgi:hypothetical protein